MEEILSFLTASFFLTLAPGPDIFLVLGESVNKGSKSGLALAAGLVCGLPVHALVLVMGWSQFIALHPNLILGVKIAGAFYFVYLALQTFRNLKIDLNQDELNENTPLKIFKKGVLMNLLNPKVSLFFWLFFPAFLFHEDMPHGLQYAIMGGLFMLQAIVIFSLVSLTAASISAPLVANPRVIYWMNFGQGILLIGIAIYLLI